MGVEVILHQDDFLRLGIHHVQQVADCRDCSQWPLVDRLPEGPQAGAIPLPLEPSPRSRFDRRRQLIPAAHNSRQIGEIRFQNATQTATQFFGVSQVIATSAFAEIAFRFPKPGVVGSNPARGIFQIAALGRVCNLPLDDL